MTATDSNGGVIVREVYIEASQETVFAFFTDPDKMTRWMGTSATLEPQVDGLYLVNIAKNTVAKGEYREVLPNSRIAFSFGWDSENAGLCSAWSGSWKVAGVCYVLLAGGRTRQPCHTTVHCSDLSRANDSNSRANKPIRF